MLRDRLADGQCLSWRATGEYHSGANPTIDAGPHRSSGQVTSVSLPFEAITDGELPELTTEKTLRQSPGQFDPLFIRENTVRRIRQLQRSRRRQDRGPETVFRQMPGEGLDSDGSAVAHRRKVSDNQKGFFHDAESCVTTSIDKENGAPKCVWRSGVVNPIGGHRLGVDRFLDTPIKRYSSGMKVRLAFAVAAHLEPEILIIDEVLAVGDHEFQQRCLGKMQAVAKSGRTVLFVSHNIPAIQALCTRAILLEHGTLSAQGTTDEVLEVYMQSFRRESRSEFDLTHVSRMQSSYVCLMKSGQMTNVHGDPITRIAIGESLSISVAFASPDASFRPVLGVVVKNSMGAALFGTDNRIQSEYLPAQPRSQGIIQIRFDSLPLQPGTYSVDLYLGDESRSLDAIESALTLTVDASNYMGSGRLPPSSCGPFLMKASWTIRDSVKDGH